MCNINLDIHPDNYLPEQDGILRVTIIFDYEKDMKFRSLTDDGEITGLLSNDVDFNYFLIEWNEMRKKHYNGEISDEELEDWKLSYPKKSRSLKK